MTSVHDGRPTLKFRLPPGHDAVQVLNQSGFRPRAAVSHEDTWFERPGGAMLGSIVLRHALPEGPWTMAWETTIKTGPDAERHHLWTAVDGPRMWKRLERLGMRAAMTLKAVRVPMDKGPQHVALERVETLGEFLEVPRPSAGRHLLRELTDLLRQLGASGPEDRSYKDLARPQGTPLPT